MSLNRGLAATALVLLVAALVAACGDGGPPRVALDGDPASPGFGTVKVSGLERRELAELTRRPPSAEEWSRIFPVFTQEAAQAGDLPPVAGTYTVEDHGVSFRPRHPLVPGQAYRVYWYGTHGKLEVDAVVTLARSVEPASTTVVAVYPSGETLPSNLLRFYVQLSAPMSRGLAARHLRLLADGAELPLPFVASNVELWNPETTRLTLVLDPGRIKQGVGPNDEVGPPLVSGRSYRLEVDPSWPDAQGRPLAIGFARSFTVTTPDRRQPRLGDWSLEAPAHAEAPLVVRFPEPLDRALLESCFSVVDANGEAVAGVVEVGTGEISWSFQPARPWAPGAYELRILETLEDVAGNSLRRAFETAIEPGEESPPSGAKSITFAVPPG